MQNHNKRAEKNPDVGEKCEVLKELDRVSDFAKFVAKYLDKNRPIGTFAVDANVGLRLADQAAVVISPGFNEIAGTMQDAKAIPMTSGQGIHPREMNQMRTKTMEVGLEDEYPVPGRKTDG